MILVSNTRAKARALWCDLLRKVTVWDSIILFSHPISEPTSEIRPVSGLAFVELRITQILVSLR